MLHTELLSANPAFEELLFAPGEDAALTARLLAAGECGVETTLDGVRVLFSTRHVEAVELNGVRGLRLRMPESLAQLRTAPRRAAPGHPGRRSATGARSTSTTASMPPRACA